MSTQGGAERRITAVIPTYHRADLVGRAIDSVLDQTRPPDEVVVVDDGSTDATAERLRAYEGRIRAIHQANGGDAIARNTGVAAATHDWVAFLDSDDTWTEDHLERMADALSATDGAADFYFSDTQLAPYGGGPSTLVWDDARFSIDGPHELVDDGTDWALLRIQPMMLQSSLFSRARYLGEGGLLRVPVRSDTHLFYVMSMGRPICAVAGIGAVMTADDSSTRLTAQYSEKGDRYWTSSVRMYRDILDRERDLGLDAATVRFFRDAESVAHWRLGRMAWSARDLPRAGRELATSLRLDPRGFLGRLASRGS